jgi:hypothetical protein
MECGSAGFPTYCRLLKLAIKELLTHFRCLKTAGDSSDGSKQERVLMLQKRMLFNMLTLIFN